MKILAVIPARWGSKRFPGKPVALVAGKPLVLWVLERVRMARTPETVLVATDDERIARVVTGAGGRAVMTRADHVSGTDRVAEAAAAGAEDIVINIQGDEPLIDPRLIDALAGVLSSGGWDMATAAEPIGDRAGLHSPHVVKVVCGAGGRALYFSRSPIPWVCEEEARDAARRWHRRHIGIYAYRGAFLQRLVREPPCLLEQAERLEQLRALHIGARIRVIETESTGAGVDVPEDIPAVEEALRAGR